MKLQGTFGPRALTLGMLRDYGCGASAIAGPVEVGVWQEGEILDLSVKGIGHRGALPGGTYTVTHPGGGVTRLETPTGVLSYEGSREEWRRFGWPFLASHVGDNGAEPGRWGWAPKVIESRAVWEPHVTLKEVLEASPWGLEFWWPDGFLPAVEKLSEETIQLLRQYRCGRTPAAVSARVWVEVGAPLPGPDCLEQVPGTYGSGYIWAYKGAERIHRYGANSTTLEEILEGRRSLLSE